MRIIFMGTPRFAIPILEQLSREHQIVKVITQPDRPAGRGREPQPSRVKIRAMELGLDVMTPATLRNEGILSLLRSAKPELIVVAAFGQILPKQILDLPRCGPINVHASLLPRWRGAAPIQAAISAGDSVTGITIMQMDVGLDTGPILSQRSTTIDPRETGGELSERLANLGAELLLESIEPYVHGKLVPQPQNDEIATHAPMLRKADGRLDFFQKTATQLERQVRAYEPWPGSFLIWNDLRLVIRKASIAPILDLKPGMIGEVGQFPIIGCSEGALRLDSVQPAGRRLMAGEAYIRGAPNFVGTQLKAS